MDLMRFVDSIEELFYEVIVWLVFYPLTLWLTLRYPQRMMDYADTELGDVQSEQYNDTLSPPLFLLLSLIISYGLTLPVQVEIAANLQTKVFGSIENLLIFRAISFSLLPLFMSLQLLRKLGLKLDREELRPPFYSQCYVTAPFILVFGPGLAGLYFFEGQALSVCAALMVATLFWYLRQQAYWFATKLEFGLWRGWRYAIVTCFISLITMILLALLASSVA